MKAEARRIRIAQDGVASSVFGKVTTCHPKAAKNCYLLACCSFRVYMGRVILNFALGPKLQVGLPTLKLKKDRAGRGQGPTPAKTL